MTMTTEVARLFKYVRLLIITLVVGHSLYACLFIPSPPPHDLLTPAPLPADYSVPSTIVAEHLQIVTLDPTHLTGRFTLTLFGNSYVAQVDRVEEQGPDHFIWIGHLSGQKDSQIRVTVADQMVTAVIEVKNARYHLQPLQDNLYALYEATPMS